MLPAVGNLAAMASAWPRSFLAPGVLPRAEHLGDRLASARLVRADRRPGDLEERGAGAPQVPVPLAAVAAGSAVRKRRGPGEDGGALIDRRILDEVPGYRGPRRPVPYR